MLLAALGAAAVAATAGAVEGWRHSPDFPNGVSGYWGMVATRMPTGSPVYVKPDCSDPHDSDPHKAGGPIPQGFVPVRVIDCRDSADEPGTVTQHETRDPKAVQALLTAYRTTHVREYISSEMFCAAFADSDPAIVFVDVHGVAIAPAAPRDTCDHVVTAVHTAVENGQWTVTSFVTAH